MDFSVSFSLDKCSSVKYFSCVTQNQIVSRFLFQFLLPALSFLPRLVPSQYLHLKILSTKTWLCSNTESHSNHDGCGELPTVCRYLCKLSDQELRQSAARNMADLMWSTVKEPLDSTLCFDKESLDLAFKYFMSPTLTMRLAGLSQITVSHCGQHFDLILKALHWCSDLPPELSPPTSIEPASHFQRCL